MVRICFITTVPGTIKSFFRSQINYLLDNGFDVTVICSNGECLIGLLDRRVNYISVDIPRGLSVLKTIKSIISLKYIFDKGKYDIVQYSTPNAGFSAAIASKMARCKVRNYHLMGFRYLGAHGIMRSVLKLVEKIACACSTSIECVSPSNLELGIQEHIFPRLKATVVWKGSTGGVNLKKYDYNKRKEWRNDIRKELGYDELDFVYGFVGRITKDKGINELLEAFLSLNDDSKLFLIGNMEGEKTLNKVILEKARKAENIKFHEAVMDIERYYAAIDVLILPSYREGFGNVIIEAGAVGTPAIVSNIPGPIDTINKNKTALVVPIKNVPALVDAMRKIRIIDYETMGKDASLFVKENFDSFQLCKKILERKKHLIQVD